MNDKELIDIISKALMLKRSERNYLTGFTANVTNRNYTIIQLVDAQLQAYVTILRLIQFPESFKEENEFLVPDRVKKAIDKQKEIDKKCK